MVDNSGFGLDNELAYTKSQFIQEVEKILVDNPIIHTYVTNVGQFQVYVGLFEKTGKSQVKKIGNNTYRIDTEQGYKIRLHNTDILIFENNTIKLNNGGWYSKTTKDRMNEYLTGYYIKQKDYQWYVVNTITGDTVDYQNNMTLK